MHNLVKLACSVCVIKSSIRLGLDSKHLVGLPARSFGAGAEPTPNIYAKQVS